MTSDPGTTGAPAAARALLIEQQLPTWDARSFRAVLVDAAPAQAYQAVRALDPEQVARSVPVMRLMGQARALPARLASRRRETQPPGPDALSADQAQEAFVPIAEEPGVEFVVGMIGKFMTPTQLEFRRFDPAGFAGFAEPGYGKVAVSFLVLPYGTTRALLCTETRTATTDPASAQQFRRYWAVIGPFAGYLMRQWLLLAKRHAEHGHPAPQPAAPGSGDDR
jgi:hypothetical protein